MATISAPNNYCLFTLDVAPGDNFSLTLVSNLNSLPGTLVAYIPSQQDLQTVGNFLVAALNGKNPQQVNLSQNVSGKRTLSLSTSAGTVTVTIYEENISTTLSVVFSMTYHYFILAVAANDSLIWSGSEAPKLVPPTT